MLTCVDGHGLLCCTKNIRDSSSHLAVGSNIGLRLTENSLKDGPTNSLFRPAVRSITEHFKISCNLDMMRCSHCCMYVHNKNSLRIQCYVELQECVFEAGIVIVFDCKDPIVLHEASVEIWTYLTWMSSEQSGKWRGLLIKIVSKYLPSGSPIQLHRNDMENREPLTLKGQCQPHGLGIILSESCSNLLLHCTKWGF